MISMIRPRVHLDLPLAVVLAVGDLGADRVAGHRAAVVSFGDEEVFMPVRIGRNDESEPAFVVAIWHAGDIHRWLQSLPGWRQQEYAVRPHARGSRGPEPIRRAGLRGRSR